ncbi:hypothetical protein [Haloarchaeobius sp. DYHT-AS-18]|uniref:hypothetical protein n=1 Tax=Haloarchaeobius sp. DYHT-AS-18 TaxID=3446117 RepID=UPI003EBA6403
MDRNRYLIYQDGELKTTDGTNSYWVLMKKRLIEGLFAISGFILFAILSLILFVCFALIDRPIIAIYFALIYISALSIEIWKTGQVIKYHFEERWKNVSPPHTEGVEIPDGVLRKLAWFAKPVFHSETREIRFTSPRKSAVAACVFYARGLISIIVFGGVVSIIRDATGVSSGDFQEAVQFDISYVPAVSTALFGPVIGIITLILENIVRYPWDVVVILAFVGVPMYFFIPAVDNSMAAISSYFWRLYK